MLRVGSLLVVGLAFLGAVSPGDAQGVRWQKYVSRGGPDAQWEPAGQPIEWKPGQSQYLSGTSGWKSIDPLSSATITLRPTGRYPSSFAISAIPGTGTASRCVVEVVASLSSASDAWKVGIRRDQAQIDSRDVDSGARGELTIRFTGMNRTGPLVIDSVGAWQPREMCPDDNRYIQIRGQRVKAGLATTAKVYSPVEPPAEEQKGLGPAEKTLLLLAVLLVVGVFVWSIWPWFAGRFGLKKAGAHPGKASNRHYAQKMTRTLESDWGGVRSHDQGPLRPLGIAPTSPPMTERPTQPTAAPKPTPERPEERISSVAAHQELEMLRETVETMFSNLRRIWDSQRAVQENAEAITNGLEQLRADFRGLKQILADLESTLSNLGTVVRERLPRVDEMSDLPPFAEWEAARFDHDRMAWLQRTLAALQEVVAAEQAAGATARSHHLQALLTAWQDWLQRFDEIWRRYRTDGFSFATVQSDVAALEHYYFRNPGPLSGTAVAADFDHNPVYFRRVLEGLTGLAKAAADYQQQRRVELEEKQGIKRVDVPAGTPQDDFPDEIATVLDKEPPPEPSRALTVARTSRPGFVHKEGTLRKAEVVFYSDWMRHGPTAGRPASDNRPGGSPTTSPSQKAPPLPTPKREQAQIPRASDDTADQLSPASPQPESEPQQDMVSREPEEDSVAEPPVSAETEEQASGEDYLPWERRS